MKILMASRGVIPVKAGCGGAEIVVYQLARSMALQGHEVTLVGDVDEQDFGLPVGLEVVRVRNPVRNWVRFLPDGLPRWIVQHLFGNVLVARRTRRLLRERPGSFDVVHAHGALSALLISIRCRNIPLVYTEHDATPWGCRYRKWYERWIRKVIYRALNVTAFKRADRVVTVFPSQAAEIVRYWKVDPSRVTCISNGTDPAVFRPGNGISTKIRDELGFDRYALFVGSLIPRKCPDLLLDAIAETEVPCVFVGDGPMRARLERRAQELGISDRVALVGSVPPHELRGLYSEADLLVLPTVSDTFPLVALEAMACGTPVLATRVSGLPEMIEDWQTGFLVKPGDVGQLAMGIRFLSGDEKLRRRMGQNGRRRVLEEFLWPAVTERYLSVFRSAAGLPEPEPPTTAAELEEPEVMDEPEVIDEPEVVPDPEWAATA